MKTRLAVSTLFASLTIVLVIAPVILAAPRLPVELTDLQEALPKRPADHSPETTRRVAAAANRLDRWAAATATFENARTTGDTLQVVGRLALVKNEVDRLLVKVLSHRTTLGTLPAEQGTKTRLQSFVRTCARMIDLSGRLRYVSHDAINAASFELAAEQATFGQLVDLLSSRNSSIGAAVMSEFLVDPPAGNPDGLKPIKDATKIKILNLIARSGQADLIGLLAHVVLDRRTSPAVVVYTAETIRSVGLPQNPPPNRDARLPQPEITAATLRKALLAIRNRPISDVQGRRLGNLLSWLEIREKKGLSTASYRLGKSDITPGDWLLMRNPSPYNLFSDLSPGLFTHVGIITDLQASDGIRRMVVVDLPERGTHLPATNVDVFVKRTLHYFLLRHDDPAIARKMADVARTVIGNASQFDLNFRTRRITELRGKPLGEAKITTYCAGLLLLCAQETGLPREHFFPIAERAAGGNTLANLHRIGASIGDDFISPTGPLFSASMQIAASGEPMYSPSREIEQAIYQRFGDGLIHETLGLSLGLKQSLRLKLAEASKKNPALAKALARAADVSETMDLVAAAKTAATVEILDAVAYGSSRQFETARDAITAGPIVRLRREGLSRKQIAAIQTIRRRHGDLYRRWTAETLTPRELRIAMVDYYITQGQNAIKQRFFSLSQ